MCFRSFKFRGTNHWIAHLVAVWLNGVAIPISLALNLHMIFAILFNRAARTTANILKVNLFLLNTVLTLSAQIPFLLALLGTIDLHPSLHKSIGVLFIVLSLFAVSLITIERYIAIYYPFKYHNFTKPRIIITLISCSWVVAIGCGPLTFAGCLVRRVTFISLTLFKVGLTLFMVFAHLRFLITSQKVRREIASMEQRFGQAGQGRMSRSLKGVRCSVLFLILLIVCQTPYSYMSFKIDVMHNEAHAQDLYIITFAFMPATVIPMLTIWSTHSLQATISRFYLCIWRAVRYS